MDTSPTGTRITRIGYCIECFKNHRPITGEKFVTYSDKGIFVRLAQQSPYWGFTPHVYEIVKVIGSNVVFRCICTMEDCGVQLQWLDGYHTEEGKYIPAHYDIYLIPHHWHRGIMTIENWRALLSLTRDNQYFI